MAAATNPIGAPFAAGMPADPAPPVFPDAPSTPAYGALLPGSLCAFGLDEVPEAQARVDSKVAIMGLERSVSYRRAWSPLRVDGTETL
jgi:hypothetical protein